MAVFKGALRLGLAPKVRAGLATIVIAVGVEVRLDVNQIHAGIGQLGELFQIVTAINDAGVEEGGGFGAGRVRGFAPESFFTMRGFCAGKLRRQFWVGGLAWFAEL